MTNNFKHPPKLDEHDNFENWEKSLKLWRLATDVPKIKQGTALVLHLTGKARDAVLELDIDVINSEAGIDAILIKLSSIYKKDSVDTAYESFENFIHFKRESSMNITEYIIQFEKRYNKAKTHGFVLSESSLGYFLLNQARLSDDHKKLVRATITKLDLDEVKAKLRKVFGCGESDMTEGIRVKVEDVNLAEEDVLYGYNGPRYNKNYAQSNKYYGSFSNRRFLPPPSNQPSHNNQGFGASGYAQSRGSNSPSQSYQGFNASARPRQFNVQNRTARTSERRKLRCNICESTYHLSYNCPEKRVYAAEEVDDEGGYDVVLYQSNLITEQDFKIFVVEASTSGILDSGASANVAGVAWVDSYVEGLNERQFQKVKYFDSCKTFKFGSGKVYKSLYRAELPATIGSETVLISTDVVDTSIPLLLSKEAMKKAGTNINFETDEVTMFGKKQNVKITESGHYAISLNNASHILDSIDAKPNMKINLITQACEDKKKIARKLHAQFGHPPVKKLLKLVDRAGLHKDDDLRQQIKEVNKNCQICKEYTREMPRPIVGLPHAETFNETVALDLKYFEGFIILHAIDHLTSFSSAIICKSKEPIVILKNLVKCWISIFGPPEKFMVENGGEFANSKIIELAESMNIRIITAAAYSPWSNGLVERHNATLGEILHKMVADQGSDMETALCWALQAKNSLDNVHGFSPSQLVFGQNPAIPTVLNSKMPALEESYSVDLINSNLDCMKRAREAFIQAESSEKIKRALTHNMRPSVNNRFFNGDLIFYKRNDSRRWKGPGRVIGFESSNVLIKHGSTYVKSMRVGLC